MGIFHNRCGSILCPYNIKVRVSSPFFHPLRLEFVKTHTISCAKLSLPVSFQKVPFHSFHRNCSHIPMHHSERFRFWPNDAICPTNVGACYSGNPPFADGKHLSHFSKDTCCHSAVSLCAKKKKPAQKGWLFKENIFHKGLTNDFCNHNAVSAPFPIFSKKSLGRMDGMTLCWKSLMFLVTI